VTTFASPNASRQTVTATGKAVWRQSPGWAGPTGGHSWENRGSEVKTD